MNIKVAVFAFVLFQAISLANGKSDTFKCDGQYWRYHYKVTSGAGDAESCEIANEQTKSLPGKPLRKAPLEFTKTELVECWRSLARVQVAGANCCLTDKSGNYFAADVPVCKLPPTEAPSNSDVWIFTTEISQNNVPFVKANETCRKWAFTDEFIQSKCKKERNSFLCVGNLEKFIVSTYGSKEKCEEFLAQARKATK